MGQRPNDNTLLIFFEHQAGLVTVFSRCGNVNAGANYLPGSHIPILLSVALIERKPYIVMILRCNIADELRHLECLFKFTCTTLLAGKAEEVHEHRLTLKD
jgi:hypothetical protein